MLKLTLKNAVDVLSVRIGVTSVPYAWKMRQRAWIEANVSGAVFVHTPVKRKQ